MTAALAYQSINTEHTCRSQTLESHYMQITALRMPCLLHMLFSLSNYTRYSNYSKFPKMSIQFEYNIHRKVSICLGPKVIYCTSQKSQKQNNPK